MISERLRPPHAFSWFAIALGVIFLGSLLLRLWRIEQFNTLVFDEIYYPVFANRYLTGQFVYNSHPPLSQTLMAVGMWLASGFPAEPDVINGLTGSMRSTFSYRWLNAIAGAAVPVVGGLIAYHLSQRRSLGITAALLLALDGLLLVESRYGLNNIYLLLFGLLGHLALLQGLSDRPRPTVIMRRVRWFRDYRGARFPQLRRFSDWVSDRLRTRRPLKPGDYFTLAGFWLGCAAAVKWNGLGFLLAIYGLWAIVLMLNWLTPQAISFPCNRLANLTPLNMALYFGLVPLLTYGIAWVPHLLLNPHPNLWEVHRQILAFHHAVGSGAGVHPYCSPWFSWLLMWRPVAYFYATARNFSETVPAYPALPQAAVNVVYDVHGMGNPILWWGATAAIIILLIQVWRDRPGDRGIGLYLLISYGANLLPWANVSRCAFLYHYMAALVFAILALAYCCDRLCWQGSPSRWPWGVGIITLCTVAFWFWSPLYLGLPLSPESYQLRMWFSHWI
ncbi:MAG: phospholipid carrier-dependent glycosyltransferase [Spirulina sp. DLM2.Bin59]|nr:MAG: phospholipid carrier-dependent glycosyltransferase [Spirulina sp. DLM2.Bin59]